MGSSCAGRSVKLRRLATSTPCVKADGMARVSTAACNQFLSDQNNLSCLLSTVATCVLSIVLNFACCYCQHDRTIADSAVRSVQCGVHASLKDQVNRFQSS